MIISFSGTDGSGKTTIINEVRDILSKTGIDTVYRHEYDYFLVRFLFRILGKEYVEGRKKRFVVPTARKDLLDRLWPYLVLIDTTLLILWLKLTRRKSVVLLDRFLYDQLVSFEGLGVAREKDTPVRNLFLGGIKPHIRIVLLVDPHTAFKRKRSTHGYPLALYQQGNESYSRIAKELGEPIVRTDSQLSFSLKRVLDVLFDNRKFRRIVIGHWANNRTIFKVMEDHHLSDLNNTQLKLVSKFYLRKVQLLKSTLNYIADLADEAKIDWLLYKTYMPFPYVPTHDIDILIRPSDRSKVESALESRDVEYYGDEPGKLNFRKAGLYKISIHTAVGWEGINYVSTEFLWRNVRRITWHGLKVKIPGPGPEFMSYLAHVFFELSYFRLADVIYLKGLIREGIDWQRIISESERHGWKDVLVLMIDLIETISDGLEDGIKLPYPVPYPTMVRLFIRMVFQQASAGGFPTYKAKEYFREILRYGLWRVGERIWGRPPFGEIFLDAPDVLSRTQLFN